MRMYLELTPNTKIVPFNYQEKLVSLFHKWLGYNELHDDISLYSLSWLTRGKGSKNGLHFPNGSAFQISAPDHQLLKELIGGISTGWQVGWGMEVNNITLQKTPNFGDQYRFIAQSPVLVKRKETDGNHRYYYVQDHQSDQYLTETLKKKLQVANLPDEVSVSFDRNYPQPKVKGITYKGIHIKANACPVIVSGHPRAVAFAWEVGVGNSTGIGFGALR